MKAIIMAAGKGSRISDKIGTIPKSILEINGKPIIKNTVEMLISLDIQVIVCTGYQSKVIENALSGLDVRFYYNPFYDVTNNIASLWFARKELDDDVILLSADLVFEEEIVKKLIANDNPLTMTVDKSRIFDGDFFFRLSKDGYILDFGPDMPEHLRSCEYMGLCKVKKSAVNLFKERLEEFISDNNHQVYFEHVFLSFDERSELRTTTLDISGFFWREIDFYEDYLKALKQFQTDFKGELK